MPFGLVDCLSPRMRQAVATKEGVILRVNVGCPIVTNGSLWRSCAKVHEVIEMPFGVVSGMSPVNSGVTGRKFTKFLHDVGGIITAVNTLIGIAVL